MRPFVGVRNQKTKQLNMESRNTRNTGTTHPFCSNVYYRNASLINYFANYKDRQPGTGKVMG